MSDFDPDQHLDDSRAIGPSPAWQVVPTYAAHQAFLLACYSAGVDPHNLGRDPHELVGLGPELDPAPAGSHHYVNHGMPALSAGRVINLYLAPWFDTARMDAFAKHLVEDGYLDGLAEIGSGRGTYLGSRTLPHPPTWTPGSVVTDAMVKAWLAVQIATGGLPQPDSQTLYAIFTPDDVTLAFDPAGTQAACTAFCGYHSALDQHTFYSVQSATECASCHTAAGPFAGLTMVYGHEVAEAFADPVPGAGWFIEDPKDPMNGWENGDVCSWQEHTWGPANESVQPYYTNGAGCFIGAYAPHQQPQGGGSDDQRDPNFQFPDSLPFWQWVTANVPGVFHYLETHTTPATAAVIDRWLHKLRANGYPNASAPPNENPGASVETAGENA